MLLDFDRPAEMEPTAKLPAVQCPVAQFARRLAILLEADPSVKFDNTAINCLAQEIFGCSAGHGRDAYDAAETGLNIYLHRIGLDLGNVPAAIDKLLAAQARLPLQTRRDQIQVEFQQFSTPPAEALVVVKAAALCPGMSVLEPSAGTGNIAVLARLLGADVDTNEIDPRRRELLPVQACLVSRQLPVSIPGIEHAAFSASDGFDCQKCQHCQIAGNASILAMP
jgi:hypothetical protein